MVIAWSGHHQEEPKWSKLPPHDGLEPNLWKEIKHKNRDKKNIHKESPDFRGLFYKNTENSLKNKPTTVGSSSISEIFFSKISKGILSFLISRSKIS